MTRSSLSFAPLIVLFGVLIANVFGCLLVADSDNTFGASFVAYFPLELFIALLLAAGTLIRRAVVWVWAPLPWFLAGCAVFHGLGSMVFTFGNEATLSYINASFVVDRNALIRTYLLNCTGIGAVVGAFLLVMTLLGGPKISGTRVPVDATRVMNLLLVLCLPVKFIIVIPHIFGWSAGTVPSAFLLGIGNLSDLTILFAFYTARKKPSYRLAAVGLFIIFVATAFLSLAKINIITVFVLAFVGWYLAKPNRRDLTVAAAILALVYLVLVPIISDAREVLGRHDDLSVSARLAAIRSVVVSGSSAEGGVAVDSSLQAWWARLAYNSPQAFCMAQFDAGFPGDTLDLIWMSFIPRTLWTDKPTITLGSDFNTLYTGNRSSLSAPGVFAEAYWYGGWPAVLVVSGYIGVMLSFLSKLSIEKMATSDFRWLPIAVSANILAAQIADWFVYVYVGGFAVLFAYWVAMWVLIPELKSRRKHSASWAIAGAYK